jgi:hypothetical protein
MSPKNAPRTANQDRGRGEHVDRLTVRHAPNFSKSPRPQHMADLTREEFKALAAEIRGFAPGLLRLNLGARI